jgi:adenosine kinase
MSFPGSFAEHILPEHLSHISLSFLVDSMDKRRGGCAPNIAYTLALLGERPVLMATAGQDFPEYRQWLEAHGVDTSLVREIPGKFSASFFCSSDRDNNQIASFYTGAMANAGELSFADAGPCDLAIISPNDPGAMVKYAQECRRLGIKYIYDPGQQCARSSGEELREGIVGAHMLICNDYEYELIRQKTGLEAAAMLQQSAAVIVTRGERGSTIWTSDAEYAIAAVPPVREADPTGVGDAFRAGFLRGLALGADYQVSAQIGSVAAAFVLEQTGAQSHTFSWAEFSRRYEQHFGTTLPA